MDPGRAAILREIETLVAEAVTRFGVAGEVAVQGSLAILRGSGPTVSAEIGPLAEQWERQSPEGRQRRCTEIARWLVNARRSAAAPTARRIRVRLPSFVLPLLILGLGAAGIWQAWRFLSPQSGAADGSLSQSDQRATQGGIDAYEHEREARAARVCEATRSRVMRGATVGPTDVEGWVVELWLLRDGDSAPLGDDPGLASFIDRPRGGSAGRLVWSGAPELTALEGRSTRVEIQDGSLPPSAMPHWRGARLSFTGRYVAPYFEEQPRARWIQVAMAIADRLAARFAGLYARCAGGDTHHVGAWFYGPEPAGAAAALVFFMGIFSDVPHVKDNLLERTDDGRIDRALALGKLLESTQGLSRARIATLLGTHGGMIAGRPDGPTTLHFPFSDANRAARASRDIADAMNQGPGL